MKDMKNAKKTQSRIHGFLKNTILNLSVFIHAYQCPKKLHVLHDLHGEYFFGFVIMLHLISVYLC